MGITFEPIEVVSLPNYFSELRKWEIPNTQPAILYSRLMIEDSLGSRRYIPAIGSTIKIRFMRSRTINIGLQSQSDAQTFEVVGFFDGSDRSIVGFSLDSSQVGKIYPSTVQLILRENNVDKILQKNFVLNLITSGVGC